MPDERKQRYGHYECQVQPDPRAKPAELQIATQTHDDRVEDDAVNRDRGDSRRESDEERNEYRDVTRRHLARPKVRESVLRHLA
jgi:hypothetical protein